jgi:hypothetical protein
VEFENGTGTRLTWIFGRAEICPLRVGVKGGPGFEACPGLEAGVMRSSGTNVEKRDLRFRGWFAGALLFRTSFPLSGGFRAELGAGFGAPLKRYRFRFDPGDGDGAREVFRMDPVDGHLTLGVAAALP